MTKVTLGYLWAALLFVILCSAIVFAGTYSGGSGIAEDPYKISTVADWQELIAASADWDKNFELLNDIDFGGITLSPVAPAWFWNPVEFQDIPFSGSLDGKGWLLMNLKIVGLKKYEIGDLCIGLIGWVDSGGQIQNLGVKNAVIAGDYSTGGLCGLNRGTIHNCHVAGTIEGGLDFSGGLCGINEALITYSFSACHVEGVDSTGNLCGTNGGTIHGCYSVGDVTGSQVAGGLVGENGGVVSDCYSTSSVMGYDCPVGGLCGVNSFGTIQRCYATGAVSGSSGVLIGGLCGSDYYGMIIGCFWDMETSEQTTSAGGTGRTTAEMKTLSTITSAGWDFVGEGTNGTADVWRMCADGVDYPRLSWEFSRGGDMDCPNGVGMEDLVYLAGRWLVGTPTTVGAADANGDGVVNLLDMGIVSESWMR